MKTVNLFSFSGVRAAIGATAALVSAGLLVLATSQSSGADGPGPSAFVAKSLLAQSGDSGKSASLDPAKVMGAQACTECHKQEYVAWTKSKHYASLDAKLDPNNDSVKKYCAALGVDLANLRKDSVCVTCHATPQKSEAGAVRAVSGVSCESCHGASGGEEDGWLNRHAVYGPNLTKRTDETAAHRKARIAAIEKAGMIRTEDQYAIAKNCLRCHLVGNEKLVVTGHPVGSTGFELVSWINGEVRHNFHADVQTESTTNADAPRLWTATTGRTAAERRRVEFVLAVLADLELSVRRRAEATNPAYMAQLGGRVGGLNGKLAQVAGATQAPELVPLQGLIAGALGRLFVPMPDDKTYYANLADKIAEAAAKFKDAHDGSKLAALDALIQANPPKGAPYLP